MALVDRSDVTYVPDQVVENSWPRILQFVVHTTVRMPCCHRFRANAVPSPHGRAHKRGHVEPSYRENNIDIEFARRYLATTTTLFEALQMETDDRWKLFQ